MHQHDLDLVAEYAQGTASSRVEEARRLIAGCDVCASEFRTQREMRSILESLPPVSMTDDERIRLREGVLGSIPAAATPPARPAPRAGLRRWYALGSAAAVLLMVVGLAGVLSNMSGEDTADLAVSTTEAAATGEDGNGEVAAFRAEEGAADDMADAGADTDPTAAVQADEASIPLVVELGEVGRAELDEAIERTLADIESSPAPPVVDPATFDPVPVCADMVSGPIAGLVLAVVDGIPLEVFFVVEDGAASVEAFEASPACEARPLD